MGEPRWTFRRAAPEDRRRQLAEAALRCAGRLGPAGVSVRQIAAEAGVSPGLITHHFGELEELIAYAFDIMAGGILDDVTAAMQAAGPDPAAQINAFVDASFSPSIFDPSLLGTWVVFWSLIRNMPKARAAQVRGYHAYLETVEELLARLAEAEAIAVADMRLAAVAFYALLDGLWLDWCLDPSAFRPEDGARACRYWIEGFRRGVFADASP